MIERTLFSADHESFRDAFRKFCDKEIAPHQAPNPPESVRWHIWRSGQRGENLLLRFVGADTPDDE